MMLPLIVFVLSVNLTVFLILPLSAALCGLIIKISVLLCLILPLRGLGPQPQNCARMPPRLRVSILFSASAQLLPFGIVSFSSLFAFSGLKKIGRLLVAERPRLTIYISLNLPYHTL